MECFKNGLILGALVPPLAFLRMSFTYLDDVIADPALGTAVFAATWMLSFLLLRLATAPSTGRWSSSVLPEGGEAG
eukprot:g30276.t1